MPGIDEAARKELRLTLQVVPRWQLSGDGWRQVERLLVDVIDAIARDDGPSFYRSLRQVDAAGPTRLARLGPDEDLASPGDSSAPPAPVVELINSLVHAPAGGGEGTTA
jgi:hypothetical protein